MTRRSTLIASVATLAFLLDLGTKLAAVAWLEGKHALFITNHTGLIAVRNPAGPLGLGGNGSAWVFMILSVLPLALGWHFRHKLTNVPSWGIGLALGGWIGNQIDHLFRGTVVDWIYVNPVVFNLADVACIIGLLTVAWGISFPEKVLAHD